LSISVWQQCIRYTGHLTSPCYVITPTNTSYVCFCMHNTLSICNMRQLLPVQRPTDRQATHSAHTAAHHRRRLQPGCRQKHGQLVCWCRKSIPVLLGSRHVAALKQSSRCSLADQIALHIVCMSIKLRQQHFSQHVMSLITHGLIFSWQLEMTHVLHICLCESSRCCICLFADTRGTNPCLTGMQVASHCSNSVCAIPLP